MISIGEQPQGVKVKLQEGMHDLGIGELERGSELLGGAVLFEIALAYAYASAEKKLAQKIKRELEGLSAQRYVMPYWLATIHAGLRERDA